MQCAGEPQAASHTHGGGDQMSGSFSSPTKKGGIPDLQVAAEIVTGIAMTHHCSNRVSNLILLPIFPDRLFLIDSLDIRLLHAAKHSDGEAREGADVRREIAEARTAW